MSEIAVIVETRKHKALNFVLENIMSNIPNEWRLQIFHGFNNLQYINNILEKNPFLKSIKEKIILTSLNIESTTQEASSKIMLSENFWNSVEGETILYFECDSMLCPNSEYKISDFEHFDYIGGYWGNNIPDLNTEYTWVMNGGFSLRKKQYLLDCIKYKRADYLKHGGNECEDYFFSACLDKKPLVSEVLSFSIDNGYVAPVVGVPFGLHKPWGEIPAKGHGRAYNEIKEKCEDVELLESLHNV